jgi:hypothetical protein
MASIAASPFAEIAVLTNQLLNCPAPLAKLLIPARVPLDAPKAFPIFPSTNFDAA